jgi:hypothetical protein
VPSTPTDGVNPPGLVLPGGEPTLLAGV